MQSRPVAIAASQGQLEIVAVIAIAAAGAIVGDNAGYLFGRQAGRRLLETTRGPFAARRRQVLEFGEPFFARHGPKAVFFGRWIIGLRTWASWLAGANRMHWRSFAFWNAAGGTAWATTVGLLAYTLGHSAKGALSLFGVFGAVTVIAALFGLWLRRRLMRPRS